MKTLIHLKDITKTYGEEELAVHVLKGVSFDIARGDFVSIMGPSGSGKSTLMHIMSFLDTPSGGVYKFDGDDVSGLSSDQLAQMRGSRVGFVFQSFNLLPRTTVRENVRLPLLYAGSTIDESLVDKAIENVGLSHRADHFSNQLSGGERQRVAVARALVNDPDIIFADEPTGNLDSKSGNQILKLLQDLNDKGHTIVMVTHEMDTAKHAKRIIRLRDGVLEGEERIAVRTMAKDGNLQK